MTQAPTTLVLLPGLDGTEVFFRPLMAALPDWLQARTVCYPQTGAQDYPRLLAHLRRELADLPDYYVLGASFGGPLAVMLAAAEPQRVRGLVLCASFLRFPRPAMRPYRHAARAPLLWTLRTLRRIPIWLLPSSDPFRLAKSETWSRVTATALAARMRAIGGVDVRETLRGLDLPVLCLSCAEDDVVPAHNADEICQHASQALRAITPGKHLGMWSHPHQTAQALADFVASDQAAAAKAA